MIRKTLQQSLVVSSTITRKKVFMTIKMEVHRLKKSKIQRPFCLEKLLDKVKRRGLKRRGIRKTDHSRMGEKQKE